MSIPRPEYPRPQFVRSDWLNLNGSWEFEFDDGDSGLERGLLDRPLRGSITVPFCPESVLSGIGDVDFHAAAWYRRTITIPDAPGWRDKRILLHFQAVDYDATVWVIPPGRTGTDATAVEVARHRGGFTPFCADLSAIARAGDRITIVVRARDDHRQHKPVGKQSWLYANQGCFYTRTTGIWQTVWLEPVPGAYLQRPRITPNLGESCFDLVAPIVGPSPGLTLRARVAAQGRTLAERSVPIGDFWPMLRLDIAPAERRLWSPEDPFLYDLAIQLLDGQGRVIDELTSYAGLRSIQIDGKKVLLNGRPVFQRLVLDQGYYPDGILTAPSDEALRRDIELSLAVGFNGARLHQKVFEERFLHHADRMGYLVWGEFADWGCNTGPRGNDNQQPTAAYVAQWLEAIDRDYSHPAIIGWCPLNETHQNLHDRITPLDDVTRAMFLATKALDPTRPVLDASGYSHRVPETDIYDSHDYEQDPAKFAANHRGLAEDKPFVNPPTRERWSIAYAGQPYFVSEFGGIWWNPQARPGDASWGYGDRPKSLEEFMARFKGLCDALLDDPRMFGYCYTQLTDVFQEQNGLYRFDRGQKFDAAALRAIQSRPAAIEMP